MKSWARTVLALMCAVTCAHLACAEDYALRVGWIMDGTGATARRNVYVVVQNDRVRGITNTAPRKVHVRDYSGDTAVPGLVDAHGHIALVGVGDDANDRFMTPATRRGWVMCNARTAIASGVTTLRDPGTYLWTLALRADIDRVGPRWITAGRQLVKRAPDAYMDDMFLEFDGVADARAKVRKLRDEHSDFIKIRFTKQRPLPSLEEARAVVDEAHKLGRRVAVHIDVPYDEGVRLALAAGVDSMEHNAPLRIVDDKVLADIAKHGIIVVPGMANFQARIETLSIAPEQVIEEPLRSKLSSELENALVEHAGEIHKQQEQQVNTGWDPSARRRQALAETRRAYDAGITLATGPDTGSDLLPHGSLYKDAFWYAEAGLPIEAVVRIATLNGAQAAGIDKDTGSLEPGKRADIVLLKGNLQQDYHRLKDVQLVIRDGRVVFDAANNDFKPCAP